MNNNHNEVLKDTKPRLRLLKSKCQNSRFDKNKIVALKGVVSCFDIIEINLVMIIIQNSTGKNSFVKLNVIGAAR